MAALSPADRARAGRAAHRCDHRRAAPGRGRRARRPRRLRGRARRATHLRGVGQGGRRHRGRLAELGVGVGDVVSLLLPSGIDYAICYLAAMRLGAITSGINTRLGPAEVASILRRSEPRLLVTESGQSTAPDGLRMLDRAELPGLRALGPPAHLPKPDPGRTVALVWTSGTTGEPKGAIFDHRNLGAVSVGAGPLRAAFDRRISPTPFSHVGYMTHVAEEIGYVITTVIPADPVEGRGGAGAHGGRGRHRRPGGALAVASAVGPSRVRPTPISRGMRICGTGAAPVPPSLVREMQERIGCPVVIGYTSTEAALTTGSLPGDSPEVIARTVGRARANVELRVVDDAGHARCPPGRSAMSNAARPPSCAATGATRSARRRCCGPDGWLRHRRRRVARRGRLPHAGRPPHRDVHARGLQRLPGRGRAGRLRAPGGVPGGHRGQARPGARRDRRGLRRARRRDRPRPRSTTCGSGPAEPSPTTRRPT